MSRNPRERAPGSRASSAWDPGTKSAKLESAKKAITRRTR